MNKIFKKALCIVMVLTLALGLFAVSPIAADAQMAVKTKKESYLQGETVTATVYFPAELNSLASVDVKLTYAPSKLEVVSVTSGKELEDAIKSQINGRVFSESHKTLGVINWAVAGTNNFNFRGTFATVVFKVKTNAGAGACDLGLSVTNAMNSGYVDLTSSIKTESASFEIIKVAANDLAFELTSNKTAYEVVGYNCATVDNIKIPASYAGLPVVGIAGSVFASHGELKVVEIPNTIKRIGDNAFKNCSGIASITIPDSVDVIGSGAFSNCMALKNISLPIGLETLSSKLFSGCTMLKEIEIPFTVTKIESLAFENCDSLESVKISKKTTDIADNAFVRGFGQPGFKTVEENTYLPEYISRNLDGAKITLIKDLSLGTASTVDSMQYTGRLLVPTVKVSLTSGDRVVKGTDYRIVFKNNTEMGRAKVYVVGSGDYGEGYIIGFDIVCNHKYDSKILTVAPTCTKDGYYTCTCSKCEGTVTEVVAAKGHNESDWVINLYPTIYQEGMKYTVCRTCNEKIQHNVVIPKVFPDLDNDNRIGSSDALIILQYAVELKDALKTPELRMNADTNGDQAINSSDALDILQIAVGQIIIDGYTA